MNREQVREAVRPVIEAHCEITRTVNQEWLGQQITEAVMRLDKPPTVTRGGLKKYVDEWWPEEDLEVGEFFKKYELVQMMHNYLTAAGVNVED